MREILFRGYAPAIAKYAYGYYSVFAGREHRIVNDDGVLWVFPDSVGQYTDMTDKNGVKIFEGDIVRYVNKDGTQSDYKTVWSEKFGAWVFEWVGHNSCGPMPGFCDLVEIIGNTYDNPELLEVNRWIG